MALSNPITQCVTATVSTAALIGGAYYGYRVYQEKKNKLPDEWTHVGYLKGLYAYPIKSCAPIILNQAECSSLGIKDGWLRDRVLMVVDAETNSSITARTHPELLKVQASFNRAILTLKYPNMDDIQVNLAEVMVTQKPIKANVWTATVPVYDCGVEVNKWFTKIINQADQSFRLVYYASTNCRPLIPEDVGLNVFGKIRQSDTGIFPDETAFNIINEASVDDLNTRLKDIKVSEDNFRPNFLVSGAEAYDEDRWKFVKIGENIFEVVRPCVRCVLTTIDRETGIRDKNSEPLETLRSYRLIQDPKIRKVTGLSPQMGLQVALRSGPGGTVSLNDTVYVAY